MRLVAATTAKPLYIKAAVPSWKNHVLDQIKATSLRAAYLPLRSSNYFSTSCLVRIARDNFFSIMATDTPAAAGRA